MIARQLAIKLPPDRAFEIEFEVGHPVAGLDDRRAPTHPRIGQLHAVLGLAEVDFLLVFSGGPSRNVINCRGRNGLRQTFYILCREPEDTDRAGNVLHRLLAEVGERDRELVPDVIVCRSRNAYASGLAKRLQPRGDIDAVAEDIIAVDDDIADVYAEAEYDLPLGNDAAVASQHAALNIDRAAHGIDHAGELHQHAVSGRLHDPAGVFGNGGGDEFPAMGFEGGERFDLVAAH